MGLARYVLQYGFQIKDVSTLLVPPEQQAMQQAQVNGESPPERMPPGAPQGEPGRGPADLAAGAADRTDADGSGTADSTRTDGPNGRHVARTPASCSHVVHWAVTRHDSNRKDWMTCRTTNPPERGELVRRKTAPRSMSDKPSMTDNPPNNPLTRNRKTISTSTKSRTVTSASKSTAKTSRSPPQRSLVGLQPHRRLHPQDPGTGAATPTGRVRPRRPASTPSSTSGNDPSTRRTVRDPTRIRRRNRHHPRPTGRGGSSRPIDDGDDDLMDPMEKRLNQQQRMLEQLTQAEQQREAERPTVDRDRWTPTEIPS